MAEDPRLETLEIMWALPFDATPLQRLLAWRPMTGDGWRFRAKKLRELGVHHSASYDAPPSST
jgi:hypothetical protein